MKNEGAGKGDKPRPFDRKKFEENYEAIFRKKPKKETSTYKNYKRNKMP